MKKRILFELAENQKRAEPFDLAPVGDDVTDLRASIAGPVGSPYEGGIFFMRFQLPQEYPFKPPKSWFETKILHPGINSQGQNNLDVFKEHWSPAITLCKLLEVFINYLAQPYFEDPLVPELAALYKSDPEEYFKRVKEATIKYAT